MLSSIRRAFASRQRQAPTAPSRSPSLIYAVGDVHGRSDLLGALLRVLEADAARAGEPATLIFLGDLVDRGPDSAGVVARVCALRDSGLWAGVEALKGNHEDAMLLFLEDATFGPTWTQHGGGATLASYGVAPPVGRADAAVWEATRLAFREALPPAHLAFLQGANLSLVRGDYVFVHAGVRPGVTLEDQDPHDLMWIRQDFLSSRRACDKVVVHGHTPTEAPELEPWRIGVDTGAYATGTLSAVRLTGADRAILQARAERA